MCNSTLRKKKKKKKKKKGHRFSFPPGMDEPIINFHESEDGMKSLLWEAKNGKGAVEIEDIVGIR